MKLFFSKLFYVFVLALVPAAAVASGDLPYGITSQSDHCRNLVLVALKTPPPLVLPRFVERYPNEVAEAGELFTENWRPTRSNENYLYLIDSHGNKWLTPQYHRVPYDDPHYMATHRSMLGRIERHYAELGLPMPDMLASGQIGFRYGQAVRFDNRSGGYPGGKENLDFALKLFRIADFQFHPKLDVLDFSVANTKDPEETHKKRTEILAVAHTPAFQALRDRWKGVMSKLYDRYPDPLRPGMIDDDRVPRLLMQLVREDPSKEALLFHASTSLPDMNESLDFITYKSMDYAETNKYSGEEMIRAFEYLLDNAR